jgi:hypothetical protein
MSVKKRFFIGMAIAAVFSFIWLLPARGSEGQIANEIAKKTSDVRIDHIEVIDNNLSVAFLHTSAGEEREMYWESSLFSWEAKKYFAFIPEGIHEPIHLAFFNSPFTGEEEYNAVILRVFDKEIDRVEIVKGDQTIHSFKLLTKTADERFGLFRTDNEEIYDAEYIAYNAEGEVVFKNKLS